MLGTSYTLIVPCETLQMQGTVEVSHRNSIKPFPRDTHLQYWRLEYCHIYFHTAAWMEAEQFLDSQQMPDQYRRDTGQFAFAVQGHTEQSTKFKDTKQRSIDFYNVYQILF